MFTNLGDFGTNTDLGRMSIAVSFFAVISAASFCSILATVSRASPMGSVGVQSYSGAKLIPSDFSRNQLKGPITFSLIRTTMELKMVPNNHPPARGWVAYRMHTIGSDGDNLPWFRLGEQE